MDGRSGFPDAIATIYYPDTEVQFCIGQQIRNSLKCVVSNYQKAFMVELKRVYRAHHIQRCCGAGPDELEARWGDLYPIAMESWAMKWDKLSAYLKYPPATRRLIRTTNSIEAVHRQFRKLTKTKGGFPNQGSLRKLLYPGVQNASKKWTMPIQNWTIA